GGVVGGTDWGRGGGGSVREALWALDVPVDALALDSGRGRVRLAWTLSEADASAFEAAWAATAPPAGRWQLTLERGRSLVTLAGHDLAGDPHVARAASRLLSR